VLLIRPGAEPYVFAPLDPAMRNGG